MFASAVRNTVAAQMNDTYPGRFQVVATGMHELLGLVTTDRHYAIHS